MLASLFIFRIWITVTHLELFTCTVLLITCAVLPIGDGSGTAWVGVTRSILDQNKFGLKATWMCTFIASQLKAEF